MLKSLENVNLIRHTMHIKDLLHTLKKILSKLLLHVFDSNFFYCFSKDSFHV